MMMCLYLIRVWLYCCMRMIVSRCIAQKLRAREKLNSLGLSLYQQRASLGVFVPMSKSAFVCSPVNGFSADENTIGPHF